VLLSRRTVAAARLDDNIFPSCHLIHDAFLAAGGPVRSAGRSSSSCTATTACTLVRLACGISFAYRVHRLREAPPWWGKHDSGESPRVRHAKHFFEVFNGGVPFAVPVKYVLPLLAFAAVPAGRQSPPNFHGIWTAACAWSHMCSA